MAISQVTAKMQSCGDFPISKMAIGRVGILISGPILVQNLVGIGAVLNFR